MRDARAAVVDAALAAVLEEMEVDAHDIPDVDKVTPLLAVRQPVRPTEETRLARLHDLMIELVENGCHLALVVLLGAIDIEVFQPDDGAAGLGDDLPHIAVECKLRERIGIECIFAAIPLGEAMLSAAVRGGG